MGTPVPHKINEARGRGASDVVPYKLTDEELAKYREMGKTKPNGGKKTMRATAVKTTPIQGTNLTKEHFLKLRAEGKSRSAIQKQYFPTNITKFYNQLKEWGVKDPIQEEIALEEMRLGTGPRVQSVAELPPEAPRPDYGQPAPNPPAEEKKDTESTEKETDPEASVPNTQGESTERPNQKDEDMEVPHVPIKFITLYIPIIDGGWNRFEQRLKVLEEFNEVGTEIELANIDRRRAARELFDLIQAFAGLIRSELADLIMTGEVDDHLQNFFTHHNGEHNAKILQYAKERGWRVSTKWCGKSGL